MNPMQAILNQMVNSPQVQNNPMAKNAMQMYQNGDSNGLKSMAENLCKERGITVDEAKQKVMSMFSQRKVVFILSDRNAEIARKITRRLGVGATFLDGRGAYSGEARDVIMVVVNNLQLKRLEEAVFSTDKNALYIVENSFAVRGHRDFVVNNSTIVPDFLKNENDEDPVVLDIKEEMAEQAAIQSETEPPRLGM